MEITGNEMIAALKDEAVKQVSFTAADTATVELDSLFTALAEYVQKGELVSAELVVSGDEPISLRVETNIINLPVKYVNAISKIIINDPATDVNLYMIVEHPLVTRSGLRIELAASVAAYLDDEESVQMKIANFFTKELQSIQEAKKAAEATDTEAKEDKK